MLYSEIEETQPDQLPLQNLGLVHSVCPITTTPIEYLFYLLSNSLIPSQFLKIHPESL